jgi:hypothetical protein
MIFASLGTQRSGTAPSKSRGRHRSKAASLGAPSFRARQRLGAWESDGTVSGLNAG